MVKISRNRCCTVQVALEQMTELLTMSARTYMAVLQLHADGAAAVNELRQQL